MNSSIFEDISGRLHPKIKIASIYFFIDDFFAITQIYIIESMGIFPSEFNMSNICYF